MYVKIHEQILNSSIMESDVNTRYIWMCLLVLCDKEGFIDMTIPSIARRINMDVPSVEKAIQEFCSPDPHSRSKNNDGRRLEPMRESFGWQIINYVKYRAIRDEDERREYMRDYMREHRKINELETSVNKCKHPVNSVNSCKPVLAHTEADTEADIYVYDEADASPPTPAVKKKYPTKDAVQVFNKAYTQAFGSSYTPAWGRDCKLMRSILASGVSLDSLGGLVSRFFHAENKFKGNCDIPSFVKAINRLAAEKPPPKPMAHQAAVIEENNLTPEQIAENKRRVKALIGSI